MLGLSVYVVAAAAAGCSATKETPPTPGLAARGTTLTTVKPSRQDVFNRVSLSGKVTLSPVFGLVAPVAGQVRYLKVTTPKQTPTKPTRVAWVVTKGKDQKVEVPAGSLFLGRLVDDRSNVVAGMPIVSAKYVGYGIVADIDGAQAYKISETLGSIKAQIEGGPGPFECTVLGTISALPQGVVPQPPPDPVPQPNPSGGPRPIPTKPGPGSEGTDSTSDATGLRLVCVPPAGIKMINGASATVEVITEKATNVLVLPVEAVAGGQGRGKVDIVKADGMRESRDVELGLTDGKVIEIKSGLTGDEDIAVPGPNLPEAEVNPKGDRRFPRMGK